MKIKNIVSSLLFLSVIIGFAAANIFLPDRELINSERRMANKKPSLSAYAVLNGDYFEDYENYILDSFVLRDGFRGLKAVNEYYLFAKRDNNGIYVKDGYAARLDYPLDEALIKNAAEKIEEIYNGLFSGYNTYYSIVPDKNYYMAKENGYPTMDYDKLTELMAENLDYKYIDIFGLLTIEDYYKTDLHWKQECIIPVADKLLAEMGRSRPTRDYETEEHYPFYGSYYGQAALPATVRADKLTLLRNEVLDGCVLINSVTGVKSPLYEIQSFEGIDPYDIFLSGAEPLLIIENPASVGKGTLYIVRDSYASSLSPLLIESYERIVLTDPRYIKPSDISRFIDTSESGDVLFLMSVTVLNKSYLFK